MLSFVTLVWKKDKLPPISSTHTVNVQLIQVSIKGAVHKPGSYELKKGTRLKELLELAQAHSEADLQSMNLEARLRNNQVVKVIAQNWITVHVEGAVAEPKELRLKLGTTLIELSEQIVLLPEADSEKLQRKRRLKDQETIVIPVKKIKASKKKTIPSVVTTATTECGN